MPPRVLPLWNRVALLFGSNSGFALIEAIVSILILAMVLYGAALAISNVNRLHQESELVYSRSYDLRAAVNVIGEDIHHAVEFLLLSPKRPFDYAAPQGYETVTIKRNRFSTDVVQYHLVPVQWNSDGKVAELKLSRQTPTYHEDLMAGLAPTSRFDTGPDGAATVVLESITHPNREPLSLRSNFFPRGQS